MTSDNILGGLIILVVIILFAVFIKGFLITSKKLELQYTSNESRIDVIRSLATHADTIKDIEAVADTLKDFVEQKSKYFNQSQKYATMFLSGFIQGKICTLKRIEKNK